MGSHQENKVHLNKINSNIKEEKGEREEKREGDRVDGEGEQQGEGKERRETELESITNRITGIEGNQKGWAKIEKHGLHDNNNFEYISNNNNNIHNPNLINTTNSRSNITNNTNAISDNTNAISDNSNNNSKDIRSLGSRRYSRTFYDEYFGTEVDEE